MRLLRALTAIGTVSPTSDVNILIPISSLSSQTSWPAGSSRTTAAASTSRRISSASPTMAARARGRTLGPALCRRAAGSSARQEGQAQHARRQRRGPRQVYRRRAHAVPPVCAKRRPVDGIRLHGALGERRVVLDPQARWLVIMISPLLLRSPLPPLPYAPPAPGSPREREAAPPRGRHCGQSRQAGAQRSSVKGERTAAQRVTPKV